MDHSNREDIESDNEDETEKPPKHLFLQLKEQQLQEKMSKFNMFCKNIGLASATNKTKQPAGKTNKTLTKANKRKYDKMEKKFNMLFNKSNSLSYCFLSKKNISIVKQLKHFSPCKYAKVGLQGKKSYSTDCLKCVRLTSVLNRNRICKKIQRKRSFSCSDLVDCDQIKNFDVNCLKQEITKKNTIELNERAKPIWMKNRKKNNYSKDKNEQELMSSSANARYSLNENGFLTTLSNQKYQSILTQRLFSLNGKYNSKKRKSFSRYFCFKPLIFFQISI
jgi:hypothetical protein